MAIMKQTATILVVTLTGLCGVASVDRMGLADPVWEKVLPSRALPGRPSVEERLMSDTADKLASTRKQAEDLQRQRQASMQKRTNLLAELKARLERAGVPPDPAAGDVMGRDPVVEAIIHAIAAEDDRLAQTGRELAARKAEASSLEARMIGIKNGLGPAVAAGSLSQQVERVGATDSPADRYGRILREATSRPSREKP